MKTINLSEDNKILYNRCKSKAISFDPNIKVNDNNIVKIIFDKFLEVDKRAK